MHACVSENGNTRVKKMKVLFYLQGGEGRYIIKADNHLQDYMDSEQTNHNPDLGGDGDETTLESSIS